MRIVKLALAAAVAFASLAGAAEAAKKKKDAPGKCGVGKYYDVKKKKCTSK